MKDRTHRRKLGQNYLIDPVILFEIERAISPQKNNLFFEIGPGTGALTDYLMGHNRKVIAMDLDQKNIITLSERFSKSEHEFIHGDVLKEPLDFLHKTKHRVVGNLPYNISTQIILKLTSYLNGIEDMHFLVQKEVAHRICASNQSGDWGRLGVKIASLFETAILFDVPPESFDIKPKVQSSFIRLIPRVNPMIALNKFSEFSNLVDQSFVNKRKGIRN
jgi:16S rRNA (adenine1518-N6/adenine1519-N6)-dimethyltransferase